jgi:GAF domain-containing protein
MTAWQDYVQARAVLSFEATPPEGTALRQELRPVLKEAVTRKDTCTAMPASDETQMDQSGAYTAVAAPIKLRGQVIGTLGLGRAVGDRPWTQEERALVEAVAERLALAADNMRLREDTERQAARERLIGEVTARMRETLDVETVLKTAAREVRQALGLPELVLRLGSPVDNGGNEGEEVRS